MQWSTWCLAIGCCVNLWHTPDVVQAQGAAQIPEQVTIAEALEGKTATLPCPSNDDNHRFIFWQLQDDYVIGPANPVNQSKYKYEVLSGDLYIKAVSLNDAGLYQCVSKGIHRPSAYSIKKVDLIVKQDWENLWENDTGVNLLRGLLAMVVIGVVCGISFVLFKFRRNGYKSYDLSEDDMPEDVGDSPYQRTTRRGSQELMVDTELPRALNSMYTDRL